MYDRMDAVEHQVAQLTAQIAALAHRLDEMRPPGARDLSTTEAARILGVARSTLIKAMLSNDGAAEHIPFYRAGNRRRIFHDALIAWQARHGGAPPEVAPDGQ